MSRVAWRRRGDRWWRYVTTNASSTRRRSTKRPAKKEAEPADGSGRTMADALFQIAEPGESRPKHACRTRAVGIDLGTTNSLVAIVDAGRPTALTDEHGDAI